MAPGAPAQHGQIGFKTWREQGGSAESTQAEARWVPHGTP